MRGKNDFGAWPLRIVALSATLLALGVGNILAAATGGADAMATEPVETRVAGAVEAAPGAEAVVPPSAAPEVSVGIVAVTSCDTRTVGTGVLVAEDRVLTAAHVVGDAGLVRIDIAGVTVTGEVLGVFADGRDLAVIEIDTAPIAAPVGAPIPALGDPVTVVGHPGGGPRLDATGAVVVVPDVANRVLAGDLVAVDVAVVGGVSGGPVLDAAGRLVGVVVATETVGGTALVVRVDPAEVLDAVLVEPSCPAEA